jgi:hypothetical protein
VERETSDDDGTDSTTEAGSDYSGGLHVKGVPMQPLPMHVCVPVRCADTPGAGLASDVPESKTLRTVSMTNC